jgi:hypothetical protein
MISGYVLRSGSHGTTNLAVTGRTTLPAWSAVAQNRSATLTAGQYGPGTTYTTGTGANLLTYTLGHYAEDYDYLGDLGYTQGSRTNVGGVFFDLNKYNARYCVTPEFPNGTWAYFATIQASGTVAYPYNVGPWFMGSPTGATTTTTVMANDGATQYFKGGPFAATTWASTTPAASGSTVTITWSAFEGGTYTVKATNNLTVSGTVLGSTVVSTGSSSSKTDAGVLTSSTASYDSTGY